jgi:hypothetical protein
MDSLYKTNLIFLTLMIFGTVAAYNRNSVPDVMIELKQTDPTV